MIAKESQKGLVFLKQIVGSTSSVMSSVLKHSWQTGAHAHSEQEMVFVLVCACVCREELYLSSQQSLALIQYVSQTYPRPLEREFSPLPAGEASDQGWFMQLSPVLPGAQTPAPSLGGPAWVCLGLTLWDSDNVLSQTGATSTRGPDTPRLQK